MDSKAPQRTTNTLVIRHSWGAAGLNALCTPKQQSLFVSVFKGVTPKPRHSCEHLPKVENP